MSAISDTEVDTFKIDQFCNLGCTTDEAISAVAMGVDWHEVFYFLQAHPTCPVTLAIEIVR